MTMKVWFQNRRAKWRKNERFLQDKCPIPGREDSMTSDDMATESTKPKDKEDQSSEDSGSALVKEDESAELAQEKPSGQSREMMVVEREKSPHVRPSPKVDTFRLVGNPPFHPAENASASLENYRYSEMLRSPIIVSADDHRVMNLPHSFGYSSLTPWSFSHLMNSPYRGYLSSMPGHLSPLSLAPGAPIPPYLSYNTLSMPTGDIQSFSPNFDLHHPLAEHRDLSVAELRKKAKEYSTYLQKSASADDAGHPAEEEASSH